MSPVSSCDGKICQRQPTFRVSILTLVLGVHHPVWLLMIMTAPLVVGVVGEDEAAIRDLYLALLLRQDTKVALIAS